MEQESCSRTKQFGNIGITKALYTSKAQTHILWVQQCLQMHWWWRRLLQKCPPLSSHTVLYAEGGYTPPRAEDPPGCTRHTPSLHLKERCPHTQPAEEDRGEEVTHTHCQEVYIMCMCRVVYVTQKQMVFRVCMCVCLCYHRSALQQLRPEALRECCAKRRGKEILTEIWELPSSRRDQHRLRETPSRAGYYRREREQGRRWNKD